MNNGRGRNLYTYLHLWCLSSHDFLQTHPHTHDLFLAWKVLLARNVLRISFDTLKSTMLHPEITQKELIEEYSQFRAYCEWKQVPPAKRHLGFYFLNSSTFININKICILDALVSCVIFVPAIILLVLPSFRVTCFLHRTTLDTRLPFPIST